MKKAFFLFLIGILQMVADLTGLASLKAMGAASGASPCPKVFSTKGGIDPFTCQWQLKWLTVDGMEGCQVLTQRECDKIQGPTSRRHAILSCFAYAPFLASDQTTRQMFFSSMGYHLSRENSVLHEMELVHGPLAMAQVEVISIGREDFVHHPTTFTVHYDE